MHLGDAWIPAPTLMGSGTGEPDWLRGRTHWTSTSLRSRGGRGEQHVRLYCVRAGSRPADEGHVRSKIEDATKNGGKQGWAGA